MRFTRRTIATLALVLGLVAGLTAQTAIPTSNLAWDQPAPTLAAAQNYTYKYYPDTEPSATTFATVACAGTTSPFVCVTTFPAFAPGAHTIQITATNIAGESARSAMFAFTFVVVPGAPANIRIQ